MMRCLRRAAVALVLAVPAWAAGPADAAPAPAPEPASLALVGAGLVGLGLWHRWRMPARRLGRSWVGQPGVG